MKLKLAFLFFLFSLVPVSVFPSSEIEKDSLIVLDIDNLIGNSFFAEELPSITSDSTDIRQDQTDNSDVFSSESTTTEDSPIKYEPIDIQQILANVEQNLPKTKRIPVNDRIFSTNPFFIDLLFHGYTTKPVKFDMPSSEDFIKTNYDSYFERYNSPASCLCPIEALLLDLRESTMRKILVQAPYLIAYKVNDLPDVSEFIQFKLNAKPIDESILISRNKLNFEHRQITMEKIKRNPWSMKSYAMVQFSQNYISKNWHRGGNNNISILNIVNGTFNYDNKKNIQWDNFAEWRMGFNSVEGDTLRTLNANDDILRATSKLGIKAGGKWYYSTSVDFSTHFFDSYKAVNSKTKKASFLTPVRFNMNIGLDYKYKKLLSLMFSPFSYKFIYAQDTLHINQKTFGIPKGQNILSQIGSAFTAQLFYNPTRELEIDSKFSFYTNYEKIEVDWELIANFKLNRFLSTRLSFNPRYDNTVLTDEKAKIQLKQMLTFGLSYKLL